MRILTLLALVLVLAACGTTAQVEPQQADSISVELVEPTAECHVEVEAAENAVLFTASEECSGHRILPFRIIEVGGPQILHDGGVYSGSVTVWPATHVGTFQVRHRQTGDLLGTITVP